MDLNKNNEILVYYTNSAPGVGKTLSAQVCRHAIAWVLGRDTNLKPGINPML